MEINFKKLKRMGYKVEYNEQTECVWITPESQHPDARLQLKKVAEMLEFNHMEEDELTSNVYRIQMFKALKTASGW